MVFRPASPPFPPGGTPESAVGWPLARYLGWRPSPWLVAAARVAARIYGLGAGVRRAWFQGGWGRVRRLPAPVVSVGNLTAGGTGKTPLVAHLAREFQRRGLKVVILSRGYGGRASGTACISDGERLLLTPPEAGDEACLLARELPGVPVYTGRSRYAAGMRAWRRHGPDLFLLDDGFQHFPLHRDLDLVLLDARAPLANGWLLPAGPLREAPAVLAQADFLVLTRFEAERHQASLAYINSRFPDQEVLTATIRPVGLKRYPGGESLPLASLAEIPCLAFAGLARPEVFGETLWELGADLTGWRTFPDHHPYAAQDIRDLMADAQAGGARALLTTAKDWARLGGEWEGPLPLLVLEVAAHLEPWEALWPRVAELVGVRGRVSLSPPSPEKGAAERSLPAVPPAVRRLWEGLRVRGQAPQAREVRRILVRAPNWLGDAVMSLPTVAALKRRFPQATLTILAVPRVAPLFLHQPPVAEVLVLPAGGRRWPFLWRLRGRFDLGLALPNSLEAALGLWGAGVKHRAGYATDGRAALLTLAVRGWEALKEVHLVYYYLGLLRAFGEVEERELLPPRLHLTLEEQRQGEALLEAGLPGSGPWVGLASGAAYGPAKRWPAERFARAARELTEAGARVVLLGSPGERETAAEVAARSGVPVLDLTGRTDLRQALGVLSRLSVLLCNDSGLMHAAAALGVPVVAVFGSTNPRVTAPFSPWATILQRPLECSPCLKRTCEKDYPCLTGVSVEEAVGAVRRWLAAAPPGRRERSP